MCVPTLLCKAAILNNLNLRLCYRFSNPTGFRGVMGGPSGGFYGYTIQVPHSVTLHGYRLMPTLTQPQAPSSFPVEGRKNDKVNTKLRYVLDPSLRSTVQPGNDPQAKIIHEPKVITNYRAQDSRWSLA